VIAVGALEIPMHLNDFDTQLHENIRALILNNEISQGTAAFAIAMQVVHYGFGSLSWQQRFIYLGRVLPLLRTMESGPDARQLSEIRCKSLPAQTSSPADQQKPLAIPTQLLEK
jgi:hypothetical protein